MHDLPQGDEEEGQGGEILTETEIQAKRKCPHCGLPLEIDVTIDLQQSASIRVKGAAPKVKTTPPEDEPQPVS